MDTPSVPSVFDDFTLDICGSDTARGRSSRC